MSLSLILALIPVTISAADLPKKFTLSQYVPAGSWLYLHGIDNQERAWLTRHWARVWTELESSGIYEDIIALASSARVAPENRNGQAKSTLGQWISAVGSVNWSDVFAQEFVYAQKAVQATERFEHIVLLRGKLGTGADNGAALAHVMTRIAGLSSSVKLEKTTIKGAKVWSLHSAGGETKGAAVSLLQIGDVIGFVTGPETLAQVLSLVASDGEAASFASSARFKTAMDDVQTPEDFVLFLDGKTFFGDIRRLIEMDAAKLPEGSESNTMIDTVDVVDYSITSVETEGRRQLTHTATKFQPGKHKCAAAGCQIDPRQLQRLGKFIPDGAMSFGIGGSVDLGGLYDAIRNLIKVGVPGGPGLLAKWDGILAGVRFDPKTELLSLWSGMMMQVSVAAMFIRPEIGVRGDWLMIGTKSLVKSRSFTDTSKQFQDLGQAVAGAALVGAMAASGMPPDEKTTFKKLMVIAMKVGSVLAKIDFFSSESTISTLAGTERVRTERVVTYKSGAAAGSKRPKRD